MLIKKQPVDRNLYKELEDDLGIANSNGNLQSWADLGVLLLNSVLTVEAGKASSHQGQGWEQLTDRIIEVLNEQTSPIVFVLWGAHAQKKGSIVITRNILFYVHRILHRFQCVVDFLVASLFQKLIIF